MYPFNRTTSIHADSRINDLDEEIEFLGNGNGKSHIYENQLADRLHLDHRNSGDNIVTEPKSPVEKTILASILELSSINDKWAKAMKPRNRKDESRESIFECSWRYKMRSFAGEHVMPILDESPSMEMQTLKRVEGVRDEDFDKGDPIMEGPRGSILTIGRGVHCVSNSLRPILFFFRLLAIFPTDCDRRVRRKRSHLKVLKYFFYANFVAVVVILNSWLFYHNCGVLRLYKAKFTMWHTGTVASMITAIKPLINVVVIVLSAIKFRQHRRLLKTIDMVDVCFRSAFNVSPSLKSYKVNFFLFVFFVLVTSLSLKIAEFIVTKQVLGQTMMGDISFIIVPLLSLWNVIPLLYYNLYNILIRFYCRTLIRSMNREHKKRHFSLKFYYEQFIRITNVQEAVGEVFNPILLFSLAWSLLVVCLTIYFISEGFSPLLIPITKEQVDNKEVRERLNTQVHFSSGWAVYQLVVAVIHIITICATGSKTNECTRQIVNAVLRIVPDANADLDRFQISCFVHKMTTQFMWGMTVWRAFPLERTTFFTMVSLVVTYSLVLFRFKDSAVSVRFEFNNTIAG